MCHFRTSRRRRACPRSWFCSLRFLDNRASRGPKAARPLTATGARFDGRAVRRVPGARPEAADGQEKTRRLLTSACLTPRPVSCLPAHAAPGGRAGIVAPAPEQEEPAAARLTYASRRIPGAPRRGGLGRRRGPAEAVDRDAPGPALGADLGGSDDLALPARAGRRVVSVRLALHCKRAHCKVDC